MQLLTVQCTEEAHRPVDCGTVAKWILKNSAESENMNWYATNCRLYTGSISLEPVNIFHFSFRLSYFNLSLIWFTDILTRKMSV